jgi:MFS family permease
MFRGLTRNVVVFGLVSFFTDVSSEMIYPLLPLFLTTTLGAGPAFLGVIEGLAESTASLLKLASGIWSDRVKDRTRIVLFGYTLSSVARPLVAVAMSGWHVLLIRFADRVGKGVRTSPRDAIIADSMAQARHGAAYGFHRSMDHAGAVTGPLLAAALLAWVTKDLRTVFGLAAIPAAAAVLILFFHAREAGARPARRSGPALGRLPHGPMRRYLLILFLFTLGNSTDAFLLLRASQLGVVPAQLPLLWVWFHVVKMLSTMPFGALSDRLGRRRLILAGWTVFAATYVGLALATAAWHVWALLGIYGLFYGLTEGVERALVARLALPGEQGAAFGWYNFVVGAGLLPASVLFGAIWQWRGPQAAFLVGASLAALASLLLWRYLRAGKTGT